MDKTKIKQLFCNHDYIFTYGEKDEEGKVIRHYLRCRKCGKMKKVNGPFKERVF